MKDTRVNLKRLLGYLLGLFILAIGIAVSVKSNFGCSPVASIPYTISLLTGLEMGLATTLWQSILVAAQFAILRRAFKPVTLLQLLAGFAFGYFNTLAGKLLFFLPAPTLLPMRILLTGVSILLIALGVWMYSTAAVLNLPSEGIVMVIAGKVGKPFHKIKVFFDCFSVGTSAICCLLILYSLGSVGFGTIASAVLVGVMVGVYDKAFGRGLRTFYHS